MTDKQKVVKQQNDQLTICKCCGSNACYESEFKTKDGLINTWLCMTCGYTTNTTLTADGKVLKEVMNNTAQLIKALRKDVDNLVWFPTVITLPNKGMIYPEPMKKDPDNWQWAVIKATPIPEEDRDKFPDPNNPGTNYKYKMDVKSKAHYDKLCFMDAAEELGLFNNIEIFPNTTPKNDNKSKSDK